MLSCCVRLRWSNSGAALRISSGISSLSADCPSVGGGVAGVSVPVTGGSTTSDCSVVGETLGTSALCVGSGWGCGALL